LININSSALGVVCPPPGIGAETSEISQNSIGITYNGSGVAQEGAVVDLHIGTIGTNSSALKVACPPPGHGENSGNF
jgi:hypothetical protein